MAICRCRSACACRMAELFDLRIFFWLDFRSMRASADGLAEAVVSTGLVGIGTVPVGVAAWRGSWGWNDGQFMDRLGVGGNGCDQLISLEREDQAVGRACMRSHRTHVGNYAISCSNVRTSELRFEGVSREIKIHSAIFIF